MKISEVWLKEWTGPWSDTLLEQLVMAGLEIESISPVAGDFSGVIVAAVLSAERHPKADRLQVCIVDAGTGSPLTIVCGAPNVRAGMKAALAQTGASLPGGVRIQATTLRGVASEGMLCSSTELGITEEAGAGLLVLPADAPVGTDLRQYLQLADRVLDVAITPNRGDCLSVAGLAMEIAALTGRVFQVPPDVDRCIPDVTNRVLPVTVAAGAGCPRYVGRVISGISPAAVTPVWMQERLRRGGQRCIHPLVDITNYVMLEWGQPLHAFDAEKISAIQVRKARAEENITLLDGQTKTLSPDITVIAEGETALAIAGVMGGKGSGVSDTTTCVFLESAFFEPTAVARSIRLTGVRSGSSLRFERGVDPQLQRKAIERATALILAVAGGEAGPLTEVVDEAAIPSTKILHLRADRLTRITGMTFSSKQVAGLLTQAGFSVEAVSGGWQVTVPARRFDITQEVDLTEEILRLSGYENIPAVNQMPAVRVPPPAHREMSLLRPARMLLCHRGYHEAVTYSFVDSTLQALFTPDQNSLFLLNPIVAGMNVMRASLWPGLVSVLQYNLDRQQGRVRLFETGKRFIQAAGKIREEEVISGLVSGSLFPLQWGEKTRSADFYDLKEDLFSLFSVMGHADRFSCVVGTHPALHPGQTADILCDGQPVGCLGTLHPSLLQKLGLAQPVCLFELTADSVRTGALPAFQPLSRFPLIRRDLAFIIDQAVPAKEVHDTLKKLGGDWLQSVVLFDVWQGEGIAPGRKSMAFSLVFQHPDRTLTDTDVSGLLQHAVSGLKERFAAEPRS